MIASLLGTFAVYTALIGDTTPLLGVAEASAGTHRGEEVKLTGKVVSHSGDASSAAGMTIVLADYDQAGESVTVIYRGSVPDAFRVDRSIVVDGTLTDGIFTAQADSLVTKCPSKYAPQAGATTQG